MGMSSSTGSAQLYKYAQLYIPYVTFCLALEMGFLGKVEVPGSPRLLMVYLLLAECLKLSLKIELYQPYSSSADEE